MQLRFSHSGVWYCRDANIFALLSASCYLCIRTDNHMYKISVIGTGNLATRISTGLQQAGHEIVAVFDRDIAKAEHLSRTLKRYKGKALFTSDYGSIPDSDIILIAVSDDAIEEVAGHFNMTGALVLHTSGGTEMEVLKRCGIKRYGVLYPLMTLSKSKNIDLKIIPFLLEAGSEADIEILTDIVTSLKAEYKICDSKKRLEMHVAAVFVSNFVNYMLTLAYEIANPDYVFLLPLAIESVRKGFLIEPQKVQTGPAKRADMKTIGRHTALLKERFGKEHLEVYELLTKSIIKKYNSQKSDI